jgi:hypothetical protein
MQPNGFSYKLCVISLLLLAVVQSGSCRGVGMATMSQAQNLVAAGMWGGQNVQLDVTEGGARLRFSCAQGKIERPLTVLAAPRGRSNGPSRLTPKDASPRKARS